jgi:hypothetical protein
LEEKVEVIEILSGKRIEAMRGKRIEAVSGKCQEYRLILIDTEVSKTTLVVADKASLPNTGPLPSPA